jgi:hypothetical protein
MATQRPVIEAIILCLVLLMPGAARAWDKTFTLPAEITARETNANKDIALVFSGGGIRAALGTAVALKALKQFHANAPTGRPDYLARSKYAIGLSGATWGLTPFYLKGGDIDPVFADFDGRQKFGDFSHFSITCDGPKKPRCHDQWVQDVQEHFIAPFYPGGNLEQVTMGTLYSRVTDQLPLPIFTMDRYVRVKSHLPGQGGKLSDSITHTNSCAVTTKLVCDNGMTLSLDKLERKKPQGALLLRDWMGFSSSAWAEVQDKRPVKIAIKDEHDEESEIVRFGDAGATCNLPLTPIIWMKSSVKVVLLFDFSEYDYSKYKKDKSEHPYAEMEKCLQYWAWQDYDFAGYTAKRYCATDDDHWAFTTNNCNDPADAVMTVLTHQGRPTLIHIPFLGGNKVQKLIKDFPTMAGPWPKEYTKQEYTKLKTELATFYDAVLSPATTEILAAVAH